jgi:uncharacterized protein (DUF2225 family)
MDEENKIKPLYEKEIQCPICDYKFMVTKTRGKFLKLDRRDTDNCPYYEGINPILYTAYICPECGYGALERHFSNVTVNGKAEVKKQITPKWKRREYHGEISVEKSIEIHRIVLLNYTVMHYPYDEIGKLCLKISWLYRYLKSPKETEFLVNAYKMFEKAYSNEPLEENPKNEANILFLMGEIARRLEKFKESIEWFGIALKSDGMKENPALEKLAREQWNEAKQQYKSFEKNKE